MRGIAWLWGNQWAKCEVWGVSSEESGLVILTDNNWNTGVRTLRSGNLLHIWYLLIFLWARTLSPEYGPLLGNFPIDCRFVSQTGPLSLVEILHYCNLIGRDCLVKLAPAILCHKEPVRRIQSPLYLRYFACSSLVHYVISIGTVSTHQYQ